jgi:hypothetical protein
MQQDDCATATQSHQIEDCEPSIEGTNKKRICFAIMPLGATTKEHDERYWKFFYDYVLSMAVKERPANDVSKSWIDYECEKPEAGRANIMKDVVSKLVTGDLVLAVLTDRNPNVWYELGIRHGLQLPTVMIMQEGEQIPFDIHQYGVVTYGKGIINKSPLWPWIAILTLGIRGRRKKLESQNEKQGAKKTNKNTWIYSDIYNREYEGEEGSKEKLFLEEYEKFKEKLQLFSQDVRKTVDNPVMEFKNDINVKLMARAKEVKINGKLEIRAEVTRKDCTRIPDVDICFAMSKCDIAKFDQDSYKITDCKGVAYGEFEAKGEGETRVMVMARLKEGRVVHVGYDSMMIRVRSEPS